MSEADRRDGGRGPGGRISDEEIDLAVRGMIDRQPSPSFSQRVVGRLHDGQRPRLATRWQPVLAAAVILLVAAGVWTTINRGVTKGPTPTTESRPANGNAVASHGDRELPSPVPATAPPTVTAPHAQLHAHAGQRSAQHHETTVAQRQEAAPGPGPRPGVHRLAIGSGRLAAHTGASGAAAANATAEAPVDLLPALPPIDVQPLDVPPPVVIQPVVVAPIEIPDITIPPVAPGGKPAEPSPDGGQGQKRPRSIDSTLMR